MNRQLWQVLNQSRQTPSVKHKVSRCNLQKETIFKKFGKLGPTSWAFGSQLSEQLQKMVVRQATGDEMGCRTGCQFMNISNKHKETSLAGDHICKHVLQKRQKWKRVVIWLAKTPQKTCYPQVWPHAPFVKNSKAFTSLFSHTSLHRKFLLHLNDSKKS